MTRPEAINLISQERVSAAESQIIDQSKKIEFYITEYSIEILASKIRRNEFYVPEYQREFTWEAERKSKFVESLLMGLPIPFLFFWERPDGLLEIVDGSQRLRTLEEFVLGDLRLTDLDTLTAVSGFQFSDLPDSRRRKFLNRSIRGIVLSEHADEQARFDMFERINTSSKVANMAELRRGALRGPFMSLVIELAELAEFVNLAPISKKLLLEREHEELVTRFFAYGDGLEGYKDKPAEFIFKYAQRKNREFLDDDSLVGAYRQRFADTLNFVARVFPNGFRRSRTGKATPRARFEAIAIGSYLALQQRPDIQDQDQDVLTWLEGEEFNEIVGSDGANAIGRLRGRIQYVCDKLMEG